MQWMLRFPVTLFLLALACAVYLNAGPAQQPQAFSTLPALLIGVFHHGDTLHLLYNCALAFAGGVICERGIGSRSTAMLAGSCMVLGVVAEYLLRGPAFVGLSGVSIGLVACAMMLTTPHRNRGNMFAIIVAFAAIERFILSPQIAWVNHLTGAIIGGGWIMLGSLFGAKGPRLKGMEWSHVSQVIPIIAQTDEDDAAEAERIFVDTGFENMFVLLDGNQVVGLTGYAHDPEVADIAWLSWTYLCQSRQGDGLGSFMINDLLGRLAKQGVRKIFIETSDYREDGELIYAAAHHLYQEFGGELELTIPDYHGVGEAKMIFGLENPEASAPARNDAMLKAGLAFTKAVEAPETENTAFLEWEETARGLAGAEEVLISARQMGGGMAVCAIPSDLSERYSDEMKSHGFKKCGRLNAFYDAETGQDWWQCYL